MEDAIRLDGRVLYLSQDPAIVAAQLDGRDFTRATAGPLRDNVSTDEITPVTVMLTYDERLGQFPYVGFKAGEVLPIGRDAVKNGGFRVTVAGKRYGKGSSRESSPLAELSAGIRLIVAESFERIYQQNCDNIGILTTTDFTVLDRLSAGEAVPIDEFLKGRDALTQQIIRSGGLLAYSKFADWPAPRLRDAANTAHATPNPKTLVEKIIERHLHPGIASAQRGDGVFIAADWRFSHDYFTGMCAHLMHRAFGKPAPLHAPDHIIAFQDHLVLAAQSIPHVRDGLLPGVANLAQGHTSFAQDYPVRSHGALDGVPGSEGICHALMAEQYALPGQVVTGTDSHTPHSGALGCLAFGAGATEIANSWVTGYVRCKVPETLRIEIEGRLREGVTAKDVVLHLLQLDTIRSGGAIGLVFEYGGDAVRAMSIDERATLTNMVAELGGFTGIVEPDERTVAFLKERRGVDFALEGWMKSDAGAVYRDTIRIDAATLQPMLARPGDPGNGVPAPQLEQEVAIDIAYGGSCTAGKREDFDFYHEVLRWGVENGLTVAPHTRLYLQFGTMAVRRYCEEQGYLPVFEQAGVTLVMPGCGSCANCGPGQSASADEVTISAINRNFPGRSGPGNVWLASPYTVAASALAGKISTFEQLKLARG
ncbi:aconitase family protein [Paraburkholderia phenazinium]|jgi:3-isopropylmalate/(R)-2-methylmalate dehydratase large subunit|uniref:3-isopropylmalate/(R)-2-methylmalate dehydratase large subunit n=1 Tax=Paraburkholderia phenazinium TaxID=60549 RepID=A0A1G7TUV3_9BURK|nr:aconitase family protein [Paraburkholderia phenazinium]SDG38804.1 3-isopropylmalate/(R)-2-methylmalate dehydratase large subunit [Paraburkholderia phenazinium]